MMEEAEEMMSAEEFFGIGETNFVVGHKASNPSDRKHGDKLFEETKIKMIMRLHDVSRNRAKAMIKEINERIREESGHGDNSKGGED